MLTTSPSFNICSFFPWMPLIRMILGISSGSLSRDKISWARVDPSISILQENRLLPFGRYSRSVANNFTSISIKLDCSFDLSLTHLSSPLQFQLRGPSKEVPVEDFSKSPTHYIVKPLSPQVAKFSNTPSQRLQNTECTGFVHGTVWSLFPWQAPCKRRKSGWQGFGLFWVKDLMKVSLRIVLRGWTP